MEEKCFYPFSLLQLQHQFKESDAKGKSLHIFRISSSSTEYTFAYDLLFTKGTQYGLFHLCKHESLCCKIRQIHSVSHYFKFISRYVNNTKFYLLNIQWLWNWMQRCSKEGYRILSTSIRSFKKRCVRSNLLQLHTLFQSYVLEKEEETIKNVQLQKRKGKVVYSSLF